MSVQRRSARFGVERRRRLASERNQALLRKIEGLHAEMREQVEPELGPRGRPMGEAAMAAWRRRRVDDYLALPPVARARRTWRAWSRAQRALVPVVAALLWPVVVLPLRMSGFADEDATRWGIIAFFALVPLVLVAPPRRVGRFVELPESTGPSWSRSRQAARLRRGAAAAAVGVAVVLVALIAIRPASPGQAENEASVLTPSSRLVVEQTVARACGAGLPVGVRPLRGGRFEAMLPSGEVTRVKVIFTGRRLTGAGAGYGEIVGPPPGC